MKRPQPYGAVPGPPEEDIKKAYTSEQLQEIGAIALVWNQIDLAIDWLLLITLKLSPDLWLQVTRRINGMDGKIQILRRFYETNSVLTENAKKCLKLTFDAVEEYKKYRDAMIHSLPFDIENSIAHRIGSRAELHQIILTQDALQGLYARLVILRSELRETDLLLRLGDYEANERLAHMYGELGDPQEMRRARDVPGVTAQVLVYQTRRLSLPPLPEFPDEDEAH